MQSGQVATSLSSSPLIAEFVLAVLVEQRHRPVWFYRFIERRPTRRLQSVLQDNWRQQDRAWLGPQLQNSLFVRRRKVSRKHVAAQLWQAEEGQRTLDVVDLLIVDPDATSRRYQGSTLCCF